MKEDPGFIYRGLLKTYRPDQAGDRRGRGRRHRGRHRDPPGHRHPRRGRERALRRVGSALVAVPDGRVGGTAAAPDSVRRGGRHPAHRPSHPGAGSEGARAGQPRRARRSGARQGARDRGHHRRERAARGRGDPANAARDRAHERGGGIRVRAADRHGGHGVGRLQGRPEGVRREAHPNFQRK